jgi:hypothetical protein
MLMLILINFWKSDYFILFYCFKRAISEGIDIVPLSWNIDGFSDGSCDSWWSDLDDL